VKNNLSEANPLTVVTTKNSNLMGVLFLLCCCALLFGNAASAIADLSFANNLQVAGAEAGNGSQVGLEIAAYRRVCPLPRRRVSAHGG